MENIIEVTVMTYETALGLALAELYLENIKKQLATTYLTYRDDYRNIDAVVTDVQIKGNRYSGKIIVIATEQKPNTDTQIAPSGVSNP